MKESAIENYLVMRVEQKGGLCQKITHPGRRGCPDRLVTWPNGEMYLVELKRPKGGKLSLSQVNDHRRRRARGVYVHVITSLAEADSFIDSRDAQVTCHIHGEDNFL